MNKNGHLHAIKTLPIATNEVVPFGLVERDEVLATAPIPKCPFCCAVAVACLVHLKHIVLVLLIPKRCQIFGL